MDHHNNPRNPQPPASKRGILGFAFALVVVLLALSAGMIKVLEIRMPWDAPPGPPAPHTFDFDTEPVTLRYLDPTGGVVAVPQLDEVPATGRCAMIFGSENAPNIDGYHYVLDALVTPTGQVTVNAVDDAWLRERSRDCAGAGAVATSIAEYSLDVVSGIRIATLEAEQEKKKAARESEPERPEGLPVDLKSIMEDGALPDGVMDMIAK